MSLTEAFVSDCRYCGLEIRMAAVPNGTWQPFELNGSGRHECGATFSWHLYRLGHRLLCRSHCWHCGDDVFFYTDGRGNAVLYDKLGSPWIAHRCWERRPSEHQQMMMHVEWDLRSRDYDGVATYFELGTRRVPSRIPFKPKRTLPSLRIQLAAADPQLLDDSVKTLVGFVLAKRSTLQTRPVAVPLPVKRCEKTRTHRRQIDIWHATPALFSAMRQMHLPGGVDVEMQVPW